MQWFSYLDKREVLQQEYFQLPILPSPHFRWVVKLILSYYHVRCMQLICKYYQKIGGKHAYFCLDTKQPLLEYLTVFLYFAYSALFDKHARFYFIVQHL